MDRFPIQFYPVPCLQLHDETGEVVQTLNQLTYLVNDIFHEASQPSRSPRLLIKQLATFFLELKSRGLLTCLGLRKTVASQDSELPPDKAMLINSFNRLYTVLDPVERMNNPTNVPQLTRGARAF